MVLGVFVSQSYIELLTALETANCFCEGKVPFHNESVDLESNDHRSATAEEQRQIQAETSPPLAEAAG